MVSDFAFEDFWWGCCYFEMNEKVFNLNVDNKYY